MERVHIYVVSENAVFEERRSSADSRAIKPDSAIRAIHIPITFGKPISRSRLWRESNSVTSSFRKPDLIVFTAAVLEPLGRTCVIQGNRLRVGCESVDRDLKQHFDLESGPRLLMVAVDLTAA